MTRAPAHLTVIGVQVVFKAMSLNAILQASSELADISKFRFWEDEQGAVKGIEKTDGRADDPVVWDAGYFERYSGTRTGSSP